MSPPGVDFCSSSWAKAGAIFVADSKPRLAEAQGAQAATVSRSRVPRIAIRAGDGRRTVTGEGGRQSEELWNWLDPVRTS